MGYGKRNPEAFGDPLQHVAGAAKRALEMLGLVEARGRVGCDRLSIEALVGPLHEIADREARQIARTALLEGPRDGLGSVVVGLLGRLRTVGQNGERGVRAQMDDQRGTHRREIDRAEPVPCALGLVVGDGEHRSIRKRFARAGEEEPARRRFDPVADLDRPLFAAVEGLRPDELQQLPIVRRGHALRRHFQVTQIDPVQRDGIRARIVASDGVLNGATEGLGRDVDAEVEHRMHGLETQVGRVVLLRRRGGELGFRTMRDVEVGSGTAFGVEDRHAMSYVSRRGEIKPRAWCGSVTPTPRASSGPQRAST